MNILLINHYAGSPEMGMEFRPYYFAREWTKMGHNVDIVAADYSHLRRVNPKVTTNFQKEVIDGINYHWIKTNEYDGNGIKRSITMAKFVSTLWRKARWIVNNMNPDVVICSSTYPIDTYVGQKIRRLSKKKIKLIQEVHDMWPATLIEVGGMSKKHPFVAIMQIAENSAYRKSDYVVSLLPNAEEYMKNHGLGEGKFKCIPNGIVSEEWENPLDLPTEHKEVFQKLKKDNKFIVGYFGGHAISNALDVLLEVAAKISDEQIHFVLVGDGVEKNRLQEKADSMGLKNITFLPPVSKKSIPALCDRIDCIYMGGMDVNLYRFGICLNKMFDSIAAGKPTICALSVDSYISEYGCGYDVKSGDTDAICEAITKISQLTEFEVEEMKKAGKKASEEKFNYKNLSEEFINLISGGK